MESPCYSRGGYRPQENMSEGVPSARRTTTREGARAGGAAVPVWGHRGLPLRSRPLRQASRFPAHRFLAPRLRGGLRPPWPRAWAAAGMPLLAFRFYSRRFNVHRHVNVLEDHFLSNRGPVFPRRRRDCRSNPPSPDVHRQLPAGRFRFRGSAVFS